jgi:hypothetical protein
VLCHDGYLHRWGLQHAIIEGVAFLLMQKGLGYHAATTAGKYALAWGIVSIYVELQLLQQPDDAVGGGSGRYVTMMLWEGGLATFYLVLWLCPRKYLYRRPAIFVYAQVWFCYRLLFIITVICQYHHNTRGTYSIRKLYFIHSLGV